MLLFSFVVIPEFKINGNCIETRLRSTNKPTRPCDLHYCRSFGKFPENFAKNALEPINVKALNPARSETKSLAI